MDNIFQMIMDFANKGISIDYTIIDQKANGYSCWFDNGKTYTVSVREGSSYGNEVNCEMLFTDLIEAMHYALKGAHRYFGDNERIQIHQSDKNILTDIMHLADLNVAVDYSIERHEGKKVGYAMNVRKLWSFGELISIAPFYDLDKGMSWAIFEGKEYLKPKKVDIIDEW